MAEQPDVERLRVEREAQWWRMVRDEVHRLDVRACGSVVRMADDDVVDIVIRVLRRAVKSPSEERLRERLKGLAAKWKGRMADLAAECDEDGPPLLELCVKELEDALEKP